MKAVLGRMEASGKKRNLDWEASTRSFSVRKAMGKLLARISEGMVNCMKYEDDSKQHS